MIRAMSMQVLNPNSNGNALYTPPGWYYSPIVGYFYVDANGNAFSGNPTTGAIVGPLGDFYPMDTADQEVDARTLFTNAPMSIASGAHVKVNFEFYWSGAAGTRSIKLGSCAKTMVRTYTIRNSVTVTVAVNASTTPVRYTGSGTFTYTDGGELFIQSVDYDGFATLYTWAFTEVAADFSALKITSYAKV